MSGLRGGENGGSSDEMSRPARCLLARPSPGNPDAACRSRAGIRGLKVALYQPDRAFCPPRFPAAHAPPVARRWPRNMPLHPRNDAPDGVCPPRLPFPKARPSSLEQPSPRSPRRIIPPCGRMPPPLTISNRGQAPVLGLVDGLLHEGCEDSFENDRLIHVEPTDLEVGDVHEDWAVGLEGFPANAPFGSASDGNNDMPCHQTDRVMPPSMRMFCPVM